MRYDGNQTLTQVEIDALVSVEISTMWGTYINAFIDKDGLNLLLFTMNRKVGDSFVEVDSSNPVTSESKIFDDYRKYELKVYNSPENASTLEENDYFFSAYFEIVTIVDRNVVLNIIRSFFVLLIISMVSFFIFRDTNKLIINPMKEMMEKIKKIQINPVQASREAEEERFKMEIILKHNAWKRLIEAEKNRYEPALLINTLVKSG